MTTVETAVGTAKTMVLNMGPQHPSTHGVLRILLELDGETVVKAVPDLGYLHTGIEKSCEDKTYSQAITLTDRMDYLNPLGNNLVYCLAVEKLLGLEIPKRAQYIRVMMVELQRISSHLVWLGTHAIDLGAMTVFLYCFRELLKLQRGNELAKHTCVPCPSLRVLCVLLCKFSLLSFVRRCPERPSVQWLLATD